MRRLPVQVLTVLISTCLGNVACNDDPKTGAVTVFAAASLSESFTELGAAFERGHPGTTVTFSFGSSSALADHVIQGAPADVFASADETNMTMLSEAGLVDDPAIFARNELAILVEDGNPKQLGGVADLAARDVGVVLCAEVVPCGKYARQVLDAAGVVVMPRSLEENVKGVVTKITLGEADAGIVYVTDALAAADSADNVEIPDDENAVAAYPIAVASDAAEPRVAGAFVAYVRSREGREVLESFGFLPPR